MVKKVIRLNESDLHNMVKDSVKRILKEGYLAKDKPITYDLGNGGEDKYQTLRYNGIAVGTIGHTHKNVTPAHGYFYPHPISKMLMAYAKKLGYEYAFDDNWEKAKNSKKKTLKENEDRNEYYWCISRCEGDENTPTDWECITCVEDSESSNDASQQSFPTPLNAYRDGIKQLEYYDDGLYMLQVYYFVSNGAGDYVSGYVACNAYGKIVLQNK